MASISRLSSSRSAWGWGSLATASAISSPADRQGARQPFDEPFLGRRPVFLGDRRQGPLGRGERRFLPLFQGLAVRGLDLVFPIPARGEPRLGELLRPLERLDLGGSGDRQFDQFDAGEKRLEAVIVGRRDRVELVVVAAGAGDRQAEEDRADRAGDFGQFRLAADLRIDIPRDHLARPGAAESGGDQRFVISRFGLVAGQLEGDEPVVGEVFLEGPDHPIAVSPGVGPLGVEFEPVRVGMMGQVEPVLGLAFAILGRSEQAVDDPLEGVGPVVLEEPVDIGRTRRQAGQVGRDPANPGHAVGLGGVPEPGRFEAGQDEPVDRIPDPTGLLDLGEIGAARDPERPMDVGLGRDRRGGREQNGGAGSEQGGGHRGSPGRIGWSGVRGGMSIDSDR